MFYTYVYKDPRPTKNLQPVYVGKGQGRRAYQHWEKQVKGNKGFGNFLALLRRGGLEPVIEIVKEGMGEAEAFFDEVRLIALYGRRDLKTGTLFNLTDGGEGVTGAIRTLTWRANISAAHSTTARKAAQIAATTAYWLDPDYREKTVTAIRAALKDPEVIARREAGKAAFIHTPEFAATMSAATSKMWKNLVYAEKVAEAQRAVQGTPEVRSKKAEASIATWQKPVVREARVRGIKQGRSTAASRAKTSAQSKAQWADPAYAAVQTASNREVAQRPEVKAAKAAATAAMWADPVRKAAMMAARRVKKEKRKRGVDTPAPIPHNPLNPG